MKLYEPVMLAMPLARKLGELITAGKRLPDGEEVIEELRKFGLEEICLDRGLAIHRGRFIIALTFSGREHLITDILSSTGELSDALEVMAYHDRKLEAYIVEILPANELEFEGNIGIEPVIIDDRTFELKSNPVLGHFEEDGGGIFLVIDRETYERWEEEGDTGTCPICGGSLSWKGERAYCRDCGYGVEVVGG
ncbi:membrane protein [Thermococcus atlanticus]